MSSSSVESSKEGVAEGLNAESGRGIEGGLSFDPNDPRLDEDASYGWKLRRDIAITNITGIVLDELPNPKEDSSK